MGGEYTNIYPVICLGWSINTGKVSEQVSILQLLECGEVWRGLRGGVSDHGDGGPTWAHGTGCV
jgi:hypothetical protein